jgi:hypothetical protein
MVVRKRGLCGEGDPTIFLHSRVPMERVFDGTDQENSKTQGKNGGNKKKRFFCKWRFPYSCVLHWSGMPSGKPTHLSEPPLQLYLLLTFES